MIRNLFGGATKCRTIDKLDIFGDGSCKALYRLDGNANDESGNYHGTETNVTYGGGVYERGVVIQSSKIDLGVGSKNLMPYNGSYSISVWVKRETGKLDNRIVNKVNTVSGYYGDTLNWGTDNKIYLGISKAQSTLSYWNTGVINATDDGVFHHIVAIIDRASTAKLYFDGVLQTWAVTQTMANSWDNNVNVNIGGLTDAWTYQGKYDQVRIFNRAITAQEVATLYAECAPTSIVDNIDPFDDGSLKALYQFEDNANDATGVYNGTATNMTYASGKFGNCMVGTVSNYIDTLSNFSFMTGTNAFSWSVWIKRNDSATTEQNIFTQLQTVGGAYSHGLELYNNTIRVFFNNSSVYTISAPTDTTIWHHIAVSKIGSIMSIYLDGKPTQFTSVVSLTLYSPTWMIGRGASSYGFNGSIDQLRIFNKALTPLEVASLYNETTPMEEPMSVQVDLFKDGSGKALYRLEGNALDESGNYNGTATNVTYGSGRFGRCFIGDITTRYVNTNTPSSLFAITANFSISGWYKLSATPNANGSQFVSQFEGNTPNYAGFIISIGNGVIGYGFPDKASASVGSYSITSTVGAWYHLVTTFNTSTKTSTLYINGANVQSNTNTNILSSSKSMIIGIMARDLVTSPMNGSIDQVRIFNKALTQSEVTALYNEI